MNMITKYIFIIFVLCFSIPSNANQSCNFVYNPYSGLYDIQECVSGVNFSSFYTSVFQTQNQSQWCWAASISMLFNYNGFEVDQEVLVNEAYGGLVNLPASGYTLSSRLNRNWVDKSGKSFSSRLTGLLDLDTGITRINNNQIITELSNGNPLIIGTAGHAMVLTEVGYNLDSFGNLIGWNYVGVFDPWPGRGARTLSAQEFTLAGSYDIYGQPGSMRFLAAVDVVEINNSTAPPSLPNNPPSDDASSSAGTMGYVFIFFILTTGYYRRLSQGK